MSKGVICVKMESQTIERCSSREKQKTEKEDVPEKSGNDEPLLDTSAPDRFATASKALKELVFCNIIDKLPRHVAFSLEFDLLDVMIEEGFDTPDGESEAAQPVYKDSLYGSGDCHEIRDRIMLSVNRFVCLVTLDHKRWEESRQILIALFKHFPRPELVQMSENLVKYHDPLKFAIETIPVTFANYTKRVLLYLKLHSKTFWELDETENLLLRYGLLYHSESDIHDLSTYSTQRSSQTNNEVNSKNTDLLVSLDFMTCVEYLRKTIMDFVSLFILDGMSQDMISEISETIAACQIQKIASGLKNGV